MRTILNAILQRDDDTPSEPDPNTQYSSFIEKQAARRKAEYEAQVERNERYRTACNARGYFSSRLAGRCRSGYENGGSRIHAIATGDGEHWFAKALCGAKPGRTSNGWSDEHHDGTPAEITCPRCLSRIAK